MASTTFSGPVTSTNGFIGNTTGNITGNVTGNVTGTLTGRVVGSIGARSGAGAVPLTSDVVRLTTTGADALTLGAGANGQILTIIMVVDGGDGTLTPAASLGFATVTFTAVGNAVVLQFFTAQGWMIVSNFGTTVA